MHTPADEIEDGAAFDVGDLDYDLPSQLIAQQPPPRRDDARLLVVDRACDRLIDATVRDLPGYLRPGDLLILNDTEVVPALLVVQRETGGVLQGLFVRELEGGRWEILLKNAKRCREGEALRFIARKTDRWTLRLDEHRLGGRWVATVLPVAPAEVVLREVGQTPLPPYIKRQLPVGLIRSPDPNSTTRQAGSELPALDQERVDRSRYQTVYARRPGAVAAPTAGLHLTPKLLDTLRSRGVDATHLTLHVGPGTFKPIDVDRITDHTLEAERFELPASTARAVRSCRRRGGRVVAVGTTVVRALEHCAADGGLVEPQAGVTDVFIHPPHRLRVVDALITNFHLPMSTLLALVMALCGVERVRRAYQHAVENHYRFYSYGDAMLVS